MVHVVGWAPALFASFLPYAWGMLSSLFHPSEDLTPKKLSNCAEILLVEPTEKGVQPFSLSGSSPTVRGKDQSQKDQQEGQGLRTVVLILEPHQNHLESN